MVSIPRLVVAAPASGAGKTTVATGLMAALRQRGLAVSGHKVGPDYIDPGYHALATGRPGRNLDPVLVGADLVAPLFLHGAAGAQVAVVEGVMGLYDGRGSTGEGSTAHVAQLLAAPVVLVVDARGQSRSVAALVQGFACYDRDVRLAGVILNRVGSDRHEQVLREALDGVSPVLGVLRREAAAETPSRHLGLVPAAERAPEAVAAVEQLGRLVTAGCDLDALLRVAASAAELAGPPWCPPQPTSGQERPVVAVAGGAARPRVAGAGSARPLVAVAGGAAFTFAYAETSECLSAAGADVVVVDPLRDEQLPSGTSALVLPGGFPEVYAEQLSANLGFLAAVRHHLTRPGSTTYAECAGLLLLCSGLDGSAMAGHFDAVAGMSSRLTLGYRTVVAPADNLVAAKGDVLVGHEFHRTTVDPAAGRRPAWQLPDGRLEGFTTGTSVLASYIHLHPAGVPGLARGIVERALAA